MIILIKKVIKQNYYNMISIIKQIKKKSIDFFLILYNKKVFITLVLSRPQKGLNMEKQFATIEDIQNRKAFFHHLSPADMPKGMRIAGAPEDQINQWVKEREENEEQFMKEREAEWQKIQTFMFAFGSGIIVDK